MVCLWSKTERNKNGDLVNIHQITIILSDVVEPGEKHVQKNKNLNI